MKLKVDPVIFCGSSIAANAPPCLGDYRGFESHLPRQILSLRSVLGARRRIHVSSKRNSYSQGPILSLIRLAAKPPCLERGDRRFESFMGDQCFMRRLVERLPPLSVKQVRPDRYRSSPPSF